LRKNKEGTGIWLKHEISRLFTFKEGFFFFFENVFCERVSRGTGQFHGVSSFTSCRRRPSMIPNLLNSLDDSYLAVLVSAIYFHGKWLESFDTAKTKQEPSARRTAPLRRRR
jgi:hypothetical protein